jgi:hypothetical protein
MLSPAKGGRKKRWEIVQNEDGSRVKKRVNRRGDVIIKKITPIPKEKTPKEKTPKEEKKYSKEETKTAMSKAQSLVDKIDGVPEGSTPRERKRFYGDKKRAQRKVERQVIRAERQKEKEEKTPSPKKPKLRLKMFKGGYKPKGGRGGRSKNPSPSCNPGQGGRCFDD